MPVVPENGTNGISEEIIEQVEQKLKISTPENDGGDNTDGIF